MRKTSKFKILTIAIAFVSISMLFPSNIRADEPNNVHVHTDECFAGSPHQHGPSCYATDANRTCGGHLTWTQKTSGTGYCPNGDDGTYEYTYYSATCDKCNLTYTDTVYGPCSSCEAILTPIGGTVKLRYPTEICPRPSDSFGITVMNCVLEEGTYYNANGTFSEPICNQVVTSISAVYPTQRGEDVDCTLHVTYMDGTDGTVIGTCMIDKNKDYSQSFVDIYYYGLVMNAKNDSFIKTNIIFTSTWPSHSQNATPTITIPTITQTPSNNPTPTNRIPLNTSNNGNGNGNNYASSHNITNSNGSSRGQQTGSGANTSGNTSSTLSDAQNENIDTTMKADDGTSSKREPISISIARPLTDEEKIEKVDGTMTLVKLYRNEKNDTTGVEPSLVYSSNDKSVASGVVNHSEPTIQQNTNKGKIMVFVILITMFVGVGTFGIVYIIRKKKSSNYTTQSINLSDSIRY